MVPKAPTARNTHWHAPRGHGRTTDLSRAVLRGGVLVVQVPHLPLCAQWILEHVIVAAAAAIVLVVLVVLGVGGPPRFVVPGPPWWLWRWLWREQLGLR